MFPIITLFANNLVRICRNAVLLAFLILSVSLTVAAQPEIYINQIGYDAKGSKIAIVGFDRETIPELNFTVVNTHSAAPAGFTGKLKGPLVIKEWAADKVFYQADLSLLEKSGTYVIKVSVKGKQYTSRSFKIAENLLAETTIPAILHYFRKQRANTAIELNQDKQLLLYGSNTTVDLRGGWCDASGDVSKYFSHLAYANFMSPQQIPLVTWSLINTAETVPKLINKLNLQDSIRDEALYGADYLMRSLAKDDYFYMIVFSYFSKNPADRRVVGLHANSVTTNEYQAAFREGGGMAIAALARIAAWKKDGEFTSKQYLDGAERAFAHLLKYNKQYDDDGKENIIDDYCALMAASELWLTTKKELYLEEARKRVENLQKRLSKTGYFIADDGDRPYWHASDAGLPVVALSRYLEIEKEPARQKQAKNIIKTALDYNIKITNEAVNPFGYARQTFKIKDQIKTGFFIPHTNETGWWWQGENARLASLATAATLGNSMLKEDPTKINVYAHQQLDWILGANPYGMCFMYDMGGEQVPYMASKYGHGSERGGVSNGITGKDGNEDGSGIDFKKEAAGNEWRWTEQWLPHAAWFLQAVTARAAEN